MKSIVAYTFLTLGTINAGAQITIERGAIFHLQEKATVSLQGDLSAWNNIDGEGYVEMTGNQTAGVHMNGFQISNLVLKCPIVLQSDIVITSNINIQAGHMDLDNHNMVLDEHAGIAGDKNNYIQTTGTGTIKKIVSGALYNYRIPIGTSASYMPLEISTGTNYQHGALTVSVRDGVSDHKPFQATDYLKSHWTLQQQGNLENIKMTGYYHLTDVEGRSANVSSFYWDGYSWKPQSNENRKSGKVTARISSPAGELYAMNDMLNDLHREFELLNNTAGSFAILQ